MSLWDFLFGKKEKIQQVPTMQGPQMDLFNQLIGGLGGKNVSGPMGQGFQYLSDILSNNPEAMQKFEAPYMRQFNEQIIPGLSERFASMGSGGSMGSSAFSQALGQQGAGLQEQLAALRGNLQQGAMGQLSGLLGAGLSTRPYENILRPSTQGFFGAMAPGMGQVGSYGLLKALGLF